MSTRLAQIAPLFLLTMVAATDSADAFRRIKWGPFELVPSLAVEMRSHSNVYVTSEDDPDHIQTGSLIDVRPGLSLIAKPNLQKKIRGLFVDARYQPNLTLFPGAKPICGGTGDLAQACQSGQDPDPDKFKIDQNLTLGLRYQSSSRLSFSGGVNYSHPELSKANLSLNDLRAHLGAKYDFSKTMSFQTNVHAADFETPTIDGTTPYGTFGEFGFDTAFEWRVLKTLTAGAHYSRIRRTFDGHPEPDEGKYDIGDDNNDGIDEDIKGYTQQQAWASLTKRLTRQIIGNFDFGYLWRDHDERQFGASSYGDFFARTTWDTLLGKRTKLQATADYQLTDTVRRLDFAEINAFTNDQLGQFTVLPEQFAVVRSRRAVLDLTRSLFRRGDQVVLGVAWQKNALRDQYGTGNFYNFVKTGPGKYDLKRRDDLIEGRGVTCEKFGTTNPSDKSEGAIFCSTSLNDQDQTQTILTGGYRLRLRSWLGLEARAAIYDGETTQIFNDKGREERATERMELTTTKTTYWNASAGFVINIQALN